MKNSYSVENGQDMMREVGPHNRLFPVFLSATVVPAVEEKRDSDHKRDNRKWGAPSETAAKDPGEGEHHLRGISQGEREEVCGGQGIVSRRSNPQNWTENKKVIDIANARSSLQLVSFASFEQEAKAKQQKNAEIKKLTSEIQVVER